MSSRRPRSRTQVAFGAIETMRRQYSVELGEHGIRFITPAFAASDQARTMTAAIIN